jgi:hypothetical protein
MAKQKQKQKAVAQRRSLGQLEAKGKGQAIHVTVFTPDHHHAAPHPGNIFPPIRTKPHPKNN